MALPIPRPNTPQPGPTAALNIVFNGIWSRQTEYFTVPSGLLSIHGCGTADGGAQKFKVSLWKKVDGGAQYVDNTTFYFTDRRPELPLRPSAALTRQRKLPRYHLLRFQPLLPLRFD